MDNYRMLQYYNYFSTREFIEANSYDGNDLGATWEKEQTRLRIWAPTASRVSVNLYKSGDQDDCFQTLEMTRDIKGTWVTVLYGDYNGIYYTYVVTVDGESKEAVDPYAKAVGVNGRRGMIIDLSSTDPEGFRSEPLPELVSSTDAIIYELHIRDFSSDESSGMLNKGKYMAFTETGTKNPHEEATGLDYLRQLGITHVHLLPAFDYKTVDETRLNEPQFNWGYDPQHFNVPEGSYSTDPYHGEVRIKEFKQMVQALHRNGIRVIMDMVYNHTYESVESDFNRIVPGYYYRLTQEGYFSNASGCGNETASERYMMRKFIIDSLIHWVKEYRIDGFRFDLMGIHDIETMNQIRYELNKIDPTIIVYGEGWTGGLSPLPDWERALKVNICHMDTGIAVFSDNLRDGIKGSVFSAQERGFVNGKPGMEDTIKFGVVAATQHAGIDYWKVNYSNAPWAAEPTQVINYASAHDNLTLWDKLTLSCPEASREDRIKMNLLSAAIVFTCQGIPFFQAGEEFLRSKPINVEEMKFDENSYRSPDSVNSLKWDLVTENRMIVDYYKGMMEFRKAHRLLRLTTTQELQEKLSFLETPEANIVAFVIRDLNEGELCVIYNANRHNARMSIPEGEWKVYVKDSHAGTEIIETITDGAVIIEAISAMILAK